MVVDIAPREDLGPYRVEEVLGRGGMGTVYRASLREPRHGLDTGDCVALKVFHPTLLDTPVFVERLEREVTLGVRVAHPNVVRAFGQEALGTAERPHRVLVMEYVAGQTLRALLDESGRISEALARTIGLSLARGLAAIHAEGAVHRDLKPENVLLTPQHEVKIMDLGVAHVRDATLRLTRAEAFAGSVEYAAPEQFPGSSAPPDGRSDLFALGILLYEMVVGVHPFRGEGTRQVLRAILHDHPPKAGDVNPQVSPFLEEVIDTLLAKRPEARFDSADALIRVLVEGESGTWWAGRAQALRQSLGGGLRRIQVPHETAVVGRESELAALREAFECAKSGSGQVVLLRGEPGIGKTRLAEEFARRLAQEGEPFDLIAGAYPPGGVATVHGAFSAAFRERLGAEDLKTVLAGLFSADWYLLPAFAALLTGEPRPAGAATLNRSTMCSAFASVTESLSKTAPLVIVIDDLHSAPEEGRVLFADLARALESQRVLLVGCGRRRLSASWVAEVAAMPHARQLELERLGPQDLHRLLQSALGPSRVVQDLEPTVALKSEGNPYFVLEIVRNLKEEGRIERQPDGTWRARGRTDVVAVPSSLHDLIEARLSGLGEPERDLLEVGACCGFTFDPLLVAEVAGVDRIPALRALGRTETHHRLVHSQGRVFAFDHNQVMEVLYAGLSPMLREEYHAAIAQALVRRLDAGESQETSGSVAAEACRHGLRSTRPELVLPHLGLALEHLQEGFQIGESLRLIEEVLAQPDLVSPNRRCRLLLKQNNLLGVLGKRPAQEAVLAEAAAIAESLGDEALRLDVHLARAHLAFNQGQLDEARRHFEKARTAAETGGDRASLGRAEGGLGLVAYRAGRFEDARRHFEANHAIAEALDDRPTAASALGNLGVVLQALGRQEEALDCSQRVAAAAREMGDLRIEGKCCDNLGILLQSLGRVEEARRSYERAVEIADRVGDRMSQAVGRVNLGSALREQDRLAEARECLVTALDIGREIRDPINQAISLDNLGAAALSMGDHDEARRCFEEALALCRQVGSRRDESYVLENQARLAEDEGRDDDAVLLLEESLGLRREIKYPLGEASTLAILGGVLVRQGRIEQARAAFDEAMRLATAHESPGPLLRALAGRAELADGASDALRAALGRYAGKVEREDEIRAWWALWRSTGDAKALAEARRLLAERVARAPPEYQVSMRTSVPLHRGILEADPPAA